MKYLPTNVTDYLAFACAIFATHSIVLFELVIILPTIDPGYTIHYFMHFVIGVFLYIGVITNLFAIIFNESSTIGIVLPVLLKTGWRFCSICEANCPSRARHCYTCNICVLERDHHCTFAGKCIGHKNYRYYIALLFYYVLSSSYCVFLNMDYIYDILHGWSWRALLSMFVPTVAWLFGVMPRDTLLPCGMCTLCIFGSCYLITLFIYHMRNLINGQTTHECANKIMDYSSTSWKHNVIHRLGYNWPLALFSPFIKSKLPTDGMTEVNYKILENIRDM